MGQNVLYGGTKQKNNFNMVQCVGKAMQKIFLN